jgi:hypothetical protein
MLGYDSTMLVFKDYMTAQPGREARAPNTFIVGTCPLSYQPPMKMPTRTRGDS